MIKKALIVGMGSMGRRRARLLKRIDPNIMVCGVDANQERVSRFAEENFDVAYINLEQAIAEFQPDVGIVSTSPASHHKIIPFFLEKNIHVFTELNLISDGYEDMVRQAEENGLTLFLSSTLLYRKDIQYIIEQVRHKKVNYYAHIGQYLPDWHPWESYKNFFVNDSKTNGCRENFAIDLPWILAAYGEIKEMSVLCSNLTDLEIQYPDNYLIQVIHENGSKGTIAVDVVSRKALRAMEVYSQDIYIDWEGNPNTLFSFNQETKTMDQIFTYGEIDKDDRYTSHIIENAYEEELRTFLGIIDGTAAPRYTFEDDKKTLALIDQIEAQAKTV